MTKITLLPSITAEWHALINEAQVRSSLNLSEELESYLVFLLMRSAANLDISNTVLALDFLSTLQQHGDKRHERLRAVGDNCLLFAGLFPEQAQKRRVNRSYFVTMGQSAYGILADEQHANAVLFAQLSYCFESLITVLDATRQQNKNFFIDLSLPAANDLSDIGDKIAARH